MEQEQQKCYDDAFYVEKMFWGTYRSRDKNNNFLVTSLTEEICVFATRFYLKGKQEGFSDANTYEGVVGGKL